MKEMNRKYIAITLALVLIAAMALPVLAQNTAAKRYWQTQRVIIHATGTAVTSDMSDYHFMKIHARNLKIVPIENAEQIRSGTAACSGLECVNQYGIAKTYGIMNFGTQPYKVVGAFSDDTKTFEGKIYSTEYGLRCLAGGNCSATEIGSVKYTIRENYEGYGHAAVGEIIFTSGDYAGKTYISVVKGIKRASEVTISD